MQTLQAWCERTARLPLFQNLILLVIIINAALVGLETSPELAERYEGAFDAFFYLVQFIYVVEILIRIVAYYPRLWRFFMSGWNVFDFTVVMLTFLPHVGTLSTVARMARVLRVTRLVQYSSELRLIVDTMFRSIPSMGHVVLLLGLLLYVYAVLGVHLFRDVDARRWGNLGVALMTMFQTITFENWVGVCDPVFERYPWAWLFFASFILLGVFVGINLFVAVVMNNLEEVKGEYAQEKHAGEGDDMILKRVQDLKSQLADLEAALQQSARPQ